MTFKDAYTKFYEYKEDKVRNTTLKTYRDRIKYMGLFDNVLHLNQLVQHYLKVPYI